MGTLCMGGGRIEFRRAGASTAQVPIRKSVLECLRQWESRCQAALAASPIDEAALVAIDDEIGEWLHSIYGMAGCLRKQRPPAALELAAPSSPNEAEWAFAPAPWELARRRGRWLATDPAVRLTPNRRRPCSSLRWLAVMLRAPEPTDRSEGLRDAADRAIVRAISPLKVDLQVKDTGFVGGPGAMAERFLPKGGSAPAGTAFDLALSPKRTRSPHSSLPSPDLSHSRRFLNDDLDSGQQELAEIEVNDVESQEHMGGGFAEGLRSHVSETGTPTLHHQVRAQCVLLTVLNDFARGHLG